MSQQFALKRAFLLHQGEKKDIFDYLIVYLYFIRFPPSLTPLSSLTSPSPNAGNGKIKPQGALSPSRVREFNLRQKEIVNLCLLKDTSKNTFANNLKKKKTRIF